MWVVRFKSEFLPEISFQRYANYHKHAMLKILDNNAFKRLNTICEIINEEIKQENPSNPKAAETEYAQRNPAKRLGLPQEVAKLVAFLLSEDNGYVSGQTIAIDGGESNIYGNS